ncbi:hypothetical protein ACFV6F_06190 [Kitasatospora phosalacinea]|uniref:hypothetical protein n=1 Tax=Kitasatospora phosalacinea TaxID=2065 RepID=UPI00365330E6
MAHRLPDSVAAAEDVPQDARLHRRSADRTGATRPRAPARGGRPALLRPRLGSARARREAYIGEWRPEPVLTAAAPSPR